MTVVEGAFDLVAILLGAFLVLVGLGLVFAIVWIGRRSIRALPDDGAVAAAWQRRGIEQVDEADALREAAVRIQEGAVDKGHEVLGLPASSGVRLAGRLAVGGREGFVGDVWNLNSVTSSGDKVTSVTVRLRAVAVVPLTQDAPRVIVAPESALKFLADAAGLADVDLESDSFNRTFRVKAEDPARAYAVLTPQVMSALERTQGRFAFEIGDRVLTLVEVSGRGSRPAAGQQGCLEELLPALAEIVAGTREHTWPEATAADRVEPRRLLRSKRPDEVVFDPRPPGTQHPMPPSNGRIGDMMVSLVGLGFAGAGVVMILSGLG